MKIRYITPKMIQVSILTKNLVSTSTTGQDVWTDDPQDPGGALIKENSYSIWENEW